MSEPILRGIPLPPRVTAVRPAAGHKLHLTFNNGERRVFDAAPLLSLGVFSPLKNKQFFDSVRVEYGTIAWPNDIDYCPDTLYYESIEAE